MPFSRAYLAITLGMAAMLPLAASAQTTIKLTYPGSSNPCVFTTDTLGVRLDPASGELLASGNFGANCPSGQVAGPSFSNNLTSADDTAGPITLGASITLNWAADADTCTNSSTPSVAGWDGTSCSSAATCSQTHNFISTPPAAGTSSFTVTCSKNGNPTPAVSTTSITVNSGGGGTGTACPNIPASISRQTVGKTTWLGSLIAMTSNDLTAFKNVWGRDPNAPSTGTILDWPERTGVLAQLQLNKNQYLSLPFTVPTAFAASFPNAYGTLQGSTSVFNGNIRPWSMTITDSCYGAFSTLAPSLPSTTNNRCVSSNQTESGGITWSLVGNAAGATTTCQLTPGHTYYLNIIHAPLTNSDTTSGTTTSCNAASCSATLNSSYQNQ